MILDPVEPEPFPVVEFGGEETRRDPSYRWDNARRGDRDWLVLQWTLSGAGFFEDAAGWRLVPAGRLMLFTHAEDSRYGYPPGAQEPYVLRWIAVTPVLVRPLFERLRATHGAVVTMEPGGEAAGVFDDLHAGWRRRSFRDRLEQSEWITRLFLCLLREQPGRGGRPDPAELGREFLQSHHRRPLALKDVAARCGVSREHFTRAFVRRWGETPADYLASLRLDRARLLLEGTEAPVETIAAQCGFASSGTFIRAWKRRHGTTPGRSR